MLQFWIDAQLPPALAHWLRREHGADAIHVEAWANAVALLAADEVLVEIRRRSDVTM